MNSITMLQSRALPSTASKVPPRTRNFAKGWMGWTHFLCTTLPKVATEMALNVLAYNMKRVIAIVGVKGLLAAMAA